MKIVNLHGCGPSVWLTDSRLTSISLSVLRRTVAENLAGILAGV
jgi:hypothetical protein